MKIISGIFGLLILVSVLCFALSNQQQENVTLWPFLGVLQVPVYVLVLVPLVVGLFFGGFLGWLASLPHRMRARRLHKEVEVLTGRIEELLRTTLIDHGRNSSPFSLSKLAFWKRRS